jgi:hypothetical protein
MSGVNRSGVYVRGIVFVILVAVIGVRSAESRAPSADEARAAQCSVRVAELEAEVRALREQLRTATGTQNQRAVTTSTHRLSAAHEFSATKQSESCNPPFRFDSQGIKYYRPECLVSEELPDCTVPYTFTSSGSKHYKPICLDAKPSLPDCDPPYAFDSRGVKSYKSECL